MEVSLRVSLVAAGALLDPHLATLLTEETFPSLAPRLSRGAGDLFRIAPASSEALPLQSAAVILTVENDVEFQLFFPRPPAGPVNFTLSYLKKMTDEHRATIEYSDEAGLSFWQCLGVCPGVAYFDPARPDAPGGFALPMRPRRSALAPRGN